jgi:uncharacterized glyoxalase superfamily protein PhnB
MNLGAIGIAAKDPSLSIKFYSELGLSFEQMGEDHFEAKTDSGVRIMLDSFDLMKKINPDWQEPKASGVTLCFEFADSAAVDSKFDQLKKSFNELKVEKEPWDAFWGQRYSTIKDPDGNQVDLFANL